MPLSEREQQLLEQLEQQLSDEDPRFATSMREPDRPSLSTRNIVLGAVLAALGLGVLLWGVSAQLIWLGVIGVVAIAAGIYVASLRPARGGEDSSTGSTGRRRTPAGSGAATASSSSFMSGLEQRWEERRRQDP